VPVVTALLLVLALALGGAQAQVPAPQRGGTLRVGITHRPHPRV